MKITTVRKQTILWLAVMVLPAVGMAQTQELHADTVKVIRNASSVVITRCDSVTSITVDGTDKDPMFHFSYEVDVDGGTGPVDEKDVAVERWMPHVPIVDSDRDGNKRRPKFRGVYLRDIHIGALVPLDAPTGIDPSVDYGIGCVAGMAYLPWRHGPEFSIGIGLLGRRLSIHNGKMLDKAGDALVLVDRPADYNSVKSSIYTFGFTVPVMISQRIVKDFGFSVGAVANLNTYTVGMTEYKTGDIEYRWNYKNLQQRILTVDFVAAVGCVGDGALGIYAKYSPMNMFRKGYGPEFTMMSVGITVGL